MTLCNLHTHTDRSDGTSPAGEVVLRAVSRGFETLGFSDHVYTPWYAEGSLPQDLSEYISENRELAWRYAGVIEIVCGLENEFDCWLEDPRFQYVIGSRHCLDQGGEVFVLDDTAERFREGLDRYYSASGLAAAKDYYRRLCADFYSRRPDIAGHLDLIRKFNRGGCFFDETSPSYRTAALEAAEAAGESGAVFEVNTSNIARKRRRILYPADFILRFILERGYPVTVTSDSHDPSLLDGGFPFAFRRLRELGFRTALVWKDGAMREEEIPSQD